MEYSNDFHHVCNAVVDYVRSFGKFAVAWVDFNAGAADNRISANEYKRFIKLPEIVVSLGLPPSAFIEPTNPEQILPSGPGEPKSRFSHLRFRPARISQILASSCQTRFPHLLEAPAAMLEFYLPVPRAVAGPPVLPRSPNRSGLP